MMLQNSGPDLTFLTLMLGIAPGRPPLIPVGKGTGFFLG